MIYSILFISSLIILITYKKSYAYLLLPILTSAYLIIPMIMINIFGLPLSTFFTISKDIVLFLLLIISLYAHYKNNQLIIPKDILHIYFAILFYVLILIFVLNQPFIYRVKSSLLYFYLLSAFIVGYLTIDKKYIDTLIKTYIVFSMITIVFSVIDTYLFQGSIFWDYLGGTELKASINIDTTYDEDYLKYYHGQTLSWIFPRLFDLNGNILPLANSLVYSLVLYVCIYNNNRLSDLLIILIILLGLFLSSGRTAMVYGGSFLIVYYLFIDKKNFIGISYLSLIIIFLISTGFYKIIWFFIEKAYQDYFVSSDHYHYSGPINGLKTILYNPLGVGWGNESSMRITGLKIINTGGNNIYTPLGGQTGILGLTLFIYFLFDKLYKLIRNRKKVNYQNKGFVTGAIFCLLFFILQGLNQKAVLGWHSVPIFVLIGYNISIIINRNYRTTYEINKI